VTCRYETNAAHRRRSGCIGTDGLGPPPIIATIPYMAFSSAGDTKESFIDGIALRRQAEEYKKSSGLSLRTCRQIRHCRYIRAVCRQCLDRRGYRQGNIGYARKISSIPELSKPALHSVGPLPLRPRQISVMRFGRGSQVRCNLLQATLIHKTMAAASGIGGSFTT
jgi:hypothetical protein